MGIQGAPAPARLGRYELLARLATGGMGEIFLSRLEGAAGFEKLFVVKRILPHLADDARFRAMLIAEARIASKMAHANICQVNELGETDGQLYIVMEYLEGITMLPLLRRASKEGGFLDFGFVGGVIQQTTDALHYAHELCDRNGEYLGIVHRDMTPSNIFLTDSGIAKILDFGIAKVKDASANTQTGTVKGKYAYMAPEQLRGASVDRRADVFALGIVTYEMLALRRLFQRKTDYLTFRAVMEQPIPDIRRYRPDVPEPLADALMRALDRDPDTRFATARQFGTALLDAISGLRRPWSQGEISDYVRTYFADDISRRSAQIQIAVQRPGSASDRSTMPLIAHGPPVPPEEDYDEDEFPSVESTMTDAPPVLSIGRDENVPADFQGQTPPPFGEGSNTSGISLQPLQAPQPPPVIVVGKRSLIWPVVAIAMVAIAGGALFLVWKQMQKQPPAIVNITTEQRTDGSAVAAVVPDAAALATTHADAGSTGSGGAGDPPDARIRKPVRRNPYDTAMRPHRARIVRCAQDHGAPPVSSKLVIIVGTNGKPKQISLEPSRLNSTPLARCIRGVIATATFPKAATDKNVSFMLVKPD